jgi:uroporphyrin-III C-methyltransferase
VTVYLVGAGPGDPGLITAKGLDLIRSCDALVYDVLVAPELVAEAPEDALLIPRETIRQSQLNDLLVDLGQRGLEVVRLKGGDPLIFGRGGEEALELAAADIPFQIVPGVSALSAVPASAGIPITHRGVSAQVTLVSGHSATGEDLDFDQLAKTPGTLVVFMGLGHLEEIASRLIAAGKDPSTPSAVVSRGTHPDGESVTGALHEIAGLAVGLGSPALLVVGDVVTVGAQIAATFVANGAMTVQ